MSVRRVSVALVALALLGLWANRASGQSSIPTPEFFGVYALDGGKLVAVGGGRSDNPPSIQQVRVAVLGSSQASQRSAIQVGAGAHFILFDTAPAEASRALSLYRLPFVRSNITVSDIPDFRTGQQTATQRPVNLPAVLRLPGSQINLLQKPVPSQPQMIELVPDSALPPGLYGVLYAPAVSGASAAGGQIPGWMNLLLVGDPTTAASTGPCIDLIQTGGLGGMIGVDPVGSGTASFPLLDPRHLVPCSQRNAGAAQPPNAASSPNLSAAHTPEPSRVPYHNRETANSHDFAQLTASLERGENVVFVVRKGLDEVHKWGEIGSHEVVVSKTEVAFQEKGGAKIFSVTPDRLLALSKDCINGFSKAPCPATPRNENNAADEPTAYHIRVNVAVINSKGKEEKRKFDFYHPAAGSANGTNCVGCDASMDTLYALLQKIKDNK